MYNVHRLRISDITVEHQHRPLGLDCLVPRFGWKLQSGGTGVLQTAYRLQLFPVDTGENKVSYDSGKTLSDQSIEVTAEGFVPAPRTCYRVELTVWDNYGRCAQQQSCFETGLMGAAFRSKWVEPLQQPTPSTMDLAHDRDAVADDVIARDQEGNRTYEEFRPVQYIRIPLYIPAGKAVRRGRIYATAHGLYRIEVNGICPDDRLFAPENTSYEKLLQYQTYDVTGLLHSGKNMIGVTLADGWWTGRVGTTGDSCQYGDTVGLLLDGEITYMDGSTDYVSGEDGVSCAEGPIRFSDLFVGEKYDAGMEMPGWSTPDFDDAGWTKVEKKEYFHSCLMGQIAPPVRPVKIFTPEKVFTAPNGDVILDAGQVLAGQIEVTLTARAGHEIHFEHFEVLGADGNYFNSILNTNKDQTDIYVTRDGKQVFRPVFTYHGFRYVRITGWPSNPDTGKINTDQFRIIALRSEMEDIGTFCTSDERLNQLQSNIWWSQTSNTISIPTDCPQREKAGWTGDIMAYAPTLCYLTEADAFLNSWMANVRAEQLPDGAVPMIVPYLKAYATFIRNNLGTDTSCGWGDAVIIVPFTMYKAYGDRRALEENYAAMTAWMEYIRCRAQNHHPEGYENWDEPRKERSRFLWNTDFHFGDWLVPSMVLGNPDAMAMNETAYATMGIVAPAYYAFSAKNMEEISRILGKETEAVYYAQLYDHIREAFIEEYVHEDGTMDADFQGIYVIALQMGLVTDQVRPRMVEHLCRMIRENGNKLDTGFLSVLFLMDVLCSNGKEDVAYQILMQTGCPGWLYEVESGATTMWESWGAVGTDGSVSTYSYNHYAFGCIGDWMYRHIGGLQMLEPGYKRIRVAPSFAPGLAWVRVSEDTPYGKAVIEWRRVEDHIFVHTEIPVNTRAVVSLPDREEMTVGSGTYDFLV